MSKSTETHQKAPPPATGSGSAQDEGTEPEAGFRARTTWVVLLLVVLLGAALFLRFGNSILPLIREAG